MKTHHIHFISVVVVAGILFSGCSSSQEASKDDQAVIPQAKEALPPQPPAQTKTAEIVDTLSVNKQNTERPVYDSKTTSPSATTMTMPSGKFSVQVGAYKMSDNADRIVALAKDRFAKNVYLYQDHVDNLYKVMIGDFMTKDEARRFRDEMAQKFPAEYKDAWVSENTKK